MEIQKNLEWKYKTLNRNTKTLFRWNDYKKYQVKKYNNSCIRI